MPSPLIYDWNVNGAQPVAPSRPVALSDETLRDGLQCPSVRDPDIDQKVRILHFISQLGIRSANIGLPAAGPSTSAAVEVLAREIVGSRLKIQPTCASRTRLEDIRTIAGISQRTGIAIEVGLFLASSPIRKFAEGNSDDELVRRTSESVAFAVSENLPVMFVTEDSTRTSPAQLESLFTAAVHAGASGVCVCDTVGHATPWGTRNVIEFVRALIDRLNPAVRIDWHAHSDRGLSLINSIAAIEAGVDRVHGCALGIGERVGNTSLDLLLVNLHLLGWLESDLLLLGDYVRFVSEATGVEIPASYPVFGADAFRTGSGVHASALVKASTLGRADLGDRLFSAIPAAHFGLEQIIEVGPMSGMSNILHWLASRGFPLDESTAARIFSEAKKSRTVLTEDELLRFASQI